MQLQLRQQWEDILSQGCAKPRGVGWGWGGGGECGNLGVILLWVCEPVFQTYPIHMPGLRKNGPIHILDHPKCWPIHILLFDVFYPFFAGYYTDITVNSYKTKWISSLEKSLSKKICAYTRMSEKWGLSHRNPEKSGNSYTFCWKKGANHIPSSAEKGGYSARTSVLCHI